MHHTLSTLSRLLLCLVLLCGLAVPAQAQAMPESEPALLTRFLPGKTMAEANEAVKRAISHYKYGFVRQQPIDNRLVPAGWEAKSVLIVYFCNFEKMSRALAIDVRAAQFLPCRITLLETDQGVDLVVVNPAWVSESMGNPLLHLDCLQLKADYLGILEEAAR
ncbi:MAG TPA: DUF302 domain-containing protein [Thiobacillaceae bacterium]|nr:DUF302 domain-containing protein [Thiobacillaceae bacterium]HNU65296.1 DUF302 domain-containing protein [Thiobacillaceae bacterium]